MGTLKVVNKEVFKDYFEISNFSNYKRLFCFYMINDKESEKLLLLLKENEKLLKDLNIKVYVFNADSMSNNKKVKEKLELNFEIFNDLNENISKEFNLVSYREVHFKRKIAYISRGIYLVDEEAVIKKSWLEDNNSYLLDEIIKYLRGK